jgi:hypothetical protein
MAQPEPDSLGVARTLVDSFFPALAEDRDTAISFYGESSVLYFQGDQASGIAEIANYLQALPPFSLRIGGYEVQTVPGSDLWSMVVVIGSIQVNGQTKAFHSSLYVEARRQDQTAFVRYHTFKHF